MHKDSVSAYPHLLLLTILCVWANPVFSQLDSSTHVKSKVHYISGENADFVSASAISSNGDIFYLGYTYSHLFIDPLISDTADRSDSDVFLARWNPDNTTSQLITIIAGDGQDISRDLFIDDNDQIYIVIETNSTNLPVTESGYETKGGWDGYVIKTDTQGQILNGLYIGGTENDYIHAIHVKNDKLYLVGETHSEDFSTTNNALIPDCRTVGICNSTNAFIMKLIYNESGISSEYSSLFGGSEYDSLHSISVDDNNFIHVAGETNSDDIPLSFPSFQHRTGGFDGMVALFKLDNIDNNGLIYSSYIGGSQYDSIRKVTHTGEGKTLLIGETASDNFPTSKNAISESCALGSSHCNNNETPHTDLFVTLIDHTDHKVPAYSTLIGGSGYETPGGILWHQEQLYVVGETSSPDFPTTRHASYKELPCPASCKDSYTGFILRMDISQKRSKGVTYASYWLDEGINSLIDISIDTNDKLTLIGNHLSTNKRANPASVDSSNESLFIDTLPDFDPDSLGQKKRGFFGSLYLIELLGFLLYFRRFSLNPINKF